MSIKYFLKKSKCFLDTNNDIFILVIIIFVAFGSFGLGRLSKIDESNNTLRIDNIGASVLDAREMRTKGVLNKEIQPTTLSTLGGTYIGSKNGSKYHFPWCSGAKRIKEGNKVTFNTIKEARGAGYTPAGNCKGLR